MKKFVSLALSAMLVTTAVAGMASCGGGGDKYTIGMICLHGAESTYDKNFIDAMNTAAKNKGLEKELRIVTGIPESERCYEEAVNLVEKGCKVIFADSFGHEPYMLQAAEEFPDVEFCHATGTMAHTENQDNFQNAFASIYEGRYLAGVAAGMKLIEMHKANTLKATNYTDASKNNIKIGYVGAFPYAEVKSGYTSFYLGVKTTLEEESLGVTMEVQFTNSWYDETAERTAAQNLITRGAALISQHADSMGAPSACEAAGVPNVSYNGSTESACPNTYIVSSRINWVPYFEYMIDSVVNGTEIDTDWCGGLGTGTAYDDVTGAVVLEKLGTAAAAGTREKIEAVRAELKEGTVKVFDTETFLVGGQKLTTYLADVNTDAAFTPDTEAVENGVFVESKYRSAPYFDVNVDGIVLLTNA